MDSMTPPESTEPRAAARMDNEDLIDTMILLDRQAQYSFRSGGNEYKQINADVERLRAEILRRLATITPTETGRVVQLSELSDEELIRTAEQSAVMMRRDADALRRIAEKKWAIGSFDESRLLRIADRLDRLNAPTLPGRVVISVEQAEDCLIAVEASVSSFERADYRKDHGAFTAFRDLAEYLRNATAAAERAATGGA